MEIIWAFFLIIIIIAFTTRTSKSSRNRGNYRNCSDSTFTTTNFFDAQHIGDNNYFDSNTDHCASDSSCDQGCSDNSCDCGGSDGGSCD